MGLSPCCGCPSALADFTHPPHVRLLEMSIDRRQFLQACSALGLSGTLFPGALYATAVEASSARGDGPALRPRNDGRVPVSITPEQVSSAAAVAGLDFSDDETEMIAEDLTEALSGYETLRDVGLPNARRPALRFDPHIDGRAVPEKGENDGLNLPFDAGTRPERNEDLAFAGVATLASLLRAGEVTSVELTELYLSRLHRFDDKLNAVITYTEERAMEAARRADAQISAGNWRGPLHGIPYGAKDLLAVEGYPTTWGAEPYRNQVIDETATVIEKLDEAGAVCMAKLSLGALAWGDVWFEGTTRNPWNVEQGSSGSSAGPGAAVAAGCVPFAIGSETLGSIVSPSTRNGVTGLRPTFGAVSRHGAMALSWSMDKLGPMARSAVDCAIVYDAIRGKDDRDPTTVDAPFAFPASPNASDVSIGYVASAFETEYDGVDGDRETLERIKAAFPRVEPMEWPSTPPVGPILKMLEVEAAAAFDDLTRSGADDTMVRQERNAWPHVFRAARLVPAVEYIQMSRHRADLIRRTNDVMADFDVVVAPTYAGSTLGLTNLTGHPCVCLPNELAPVDEAPADSPRRQPRSITLIGGLYKEGAILQVAAAVQEVTDTHLKRPPIA